MAATIGNLFINLRANSAPLQAGLKKSASSLHKFKGKLSSASKSIAKWGSVAVAAGMAVAIAMGKRAAASIDKLAKAASKLGASTEELIALRHAAELSGVSADTFDMAMQRMIRRVSEASHGFGEAKGALKELGLSADTLSKMTLQDQMMAVTEAMSGVENQSDKVRLAMKLFDSEGVSLVNMMKDGSSGLKEMTDEASELGLTFSNVSAGQVEKMNDTFSKLGKVGQAVINHVLIAIAPALESIVAKMIAFAKESGGAGVVAVQALSAVAKAVAFVADIAQHLINGFKAISVAIRFLAGVWIGQLSLMAQGLAKLVALASDEWGAAAQSIADDISLIGEAMRDEAAADFSGILDDASGPSWGDKIESFTAGLVESMAAANGTAEAVDGLTDSTAGMSDAMSAAIVDAQSFMDALDKRIRTFGMTSDMAKIAEMERAGIDPKTIAQLRARAGMLQAMEASKQISDPVVAGRAVQTTGVETAIGSATFAFGTKKVDPIQQDQLDEQKKSSTGILELIKVGKQQVEAIEDVFGGVFQ